MSKKRKSVESKTYQNQYMLESGKKLYLDTDTADVHFSFDLDNGTVRRIGSHKILLAAVSDKFMDIFYGKSKGIGGDIKLIDVSDAAFVEFLQYFYLSKVKLTAENIDDVMLLGYKYNVKKCVEDCIQFLIDTYGLNSENVCAALFLAIQYDRRELIKLCETCITLDTAAVFDSVAFLRCEWFVLAHILKMNVFSCSEVEVFEASMAWVKIKCGQNVLTKEMIDTHLHELQYEIRFKSMTIEEFCILEAKYGTVLRTNFHTITNMIVLPQFQSENFNKHPRQAKWNEQEVITCDRTVGNKLEWHLLDIQHKSTFTTDKPLLLGSFACGEICVSHPKPRRALRANLSVEVEINEASGLKGDNAKILLKMKTELKSEETNISLLHPVLIRPGFFYSICVGNFPDEHGYCTEEMKTETRIESDINIKFHNNAVCAQDEKIIAIGLISILYFNKI